MDGGTGGVCQLDFKYVAGSEIDRECDVSINGQSVGTVTFLKTKDWNDWQHDVVQATCQPGVNVIRLTVNTSRGGPNLDNLVVVPACGSSGGSCKKREGCCSGLCLEDGTCSAPTPAPTKAPTTPEPVAAPVFAPTPAPKTKNPTSSPVVIPPHSSAEFGWRVDGRKLGMPHRNRRSLAAACSALAVWSRTRGWSCAA